MKSFRFIVFSFFMLSTVAWLLSQNVDNKPKRTAEQEAARQTEKLQSELNLTPEQVKVIYEINLKYERERQISNTRAQAMERIRNKNAELQKALTEDQFSRLQTKRFERNTAEKPANPHPTENHAPADFRSRAIMGPGYGPDLRTNYRTVPPTSTSTPSTSSASASSGTNQQPASRRALPPARPSTSNTAPAGSADRGQSQTRSSQSSTTSTERPQSAPASTGNNSSGNNSRRSESTETPRSNRR